MPDIDRPIGGVKQLYRHVEHLTTLGINAAVVTESKDFRPSWFTSNAPTESLHDCFDNELINSRTCILVLPETYVAVDLSNFRGYDLSQFYRVIFNQNAYYSFGDFSLNAFKSVHPFYHSSYVLQVLSVSEDTSRFLSNNIHIHDSKISRIINAVETIFSPSLSKSNTFTWMPRKNGQHVNAILHSIQSSTKYDFSDWKGEPLLDMTHEDIAHKLNSSKIFLSFGHPEGFGLPVAEAMASGCWVIGYSGGGGKELFRYGASTEIPYGDWTSFAQAIESTLLFFKNSPREASLRLSRQSLAVKTLYSHSLEFNSIDFAWANVIEEFKSILSTS